MESDFDLDIELHESLRGCISYTLLIFIIHNSVTSYHTMISMLHAAGNHKHGFLCEVQGFLWSYMGFYVK